MRLMVLAVMGWLAAVEELSPAAAPAPLPLLMTYQPVYVLFGNEPDLAKFQVSVRSRLYDPAWMSGQPPLVREDTGLYFGYTQTSYWDLGSDSRPFFDSSYRPELFWLQRGIHPDWLTERGELWWQGGLRHESNGQDGDESRSLNQIYLGPSLTMRWRRNRFLTFQPEAWIYIGDLGDNSDISRYRGYADLRLSGGVDDGWQAEFLGRLGDEFDRGLVQLDVSYPLSRVLGTAFRPYAHLQALSGWGESLLTYNERSDRVLIGLSFVR